ESSGLYSSDLPKLCRVTTSSPLRCSMMSLNDAHKGPSLRCSTSTIHFYREKPAKLDSSGFCGGVVSWDGASWLGARPGWGRSWLRFCCIRFDEGKRI